MKRAAVLTAVALAAAVVSAQAPADTLAGRFAVFTGAGQPSGLDAIVDAVRPGDVLFLGEQHDDRTGHALELRILEAIAARHPVVLALEMFETDVQIVLDEYASGLVDERSFLAASRPWGNYTADYAPLVDFAKARGAAVVASNAPTRYVRLVTRDGLSALAHLTADARTLLPPDVAEPSDTLAARFVALMTRLGAAHGSGGPTPHEMLAGQNLRDATMAWSIARARAAHPEAVVVHVNGSFHSADRLGIPEHLARVRPETRAVVVTMQRGSPATAPTPSGDDFQILTAAP